MLMLTTSAALFSQEDCDLFNIQELSAAYLNFSVDSTILQSDGSYEVYLSNGTTFTQIFGCTDPAYYDYNPAANTDDGSCADPAVCMPVEFDGYTYAAVEMGRRCWFAENLRTTVYANGSGIPNVTSSYSWESTYQGARCDYHNQPAFVTTYGRLYNWTAVNNIQGLCPAGWHVPTLGEWAELEDYITSQGFAGTEGTALKSTTGWNNGGNGTDDFGFSALPGGFRYEQGVFSSKGLSGAWWVSSGNSLRWLGSDEPTFSFSYTQSGSGHSVRCLRNSLTPEIQGCTNPAYIEYDAAANTDDGSCLTLVVLGCTDSTYIEYNPSADTDDDSCATLVVFGCTDSTYVEYDAAANTDDGSCLTLVVLGCTDSTYVEYDASANTDDGSCLTLLGCSDSDIASMDGYDYEVVTIGDQCWFAENLRTTVYGNGDLIPAGLTSSEWRTTTAGATAVYGEGSSGCVNYSPVIDACDEAQSLAAYGRLYNWYAVDDARGLCPAGWHVPTDGEWTALETYLGTNGHSGTEGTALRSTSGWDNGGNGTDNFGFSALPGGYRDDFYGDFYIAVSNGYWWSSSPVGANAAWFRRLNYALPGVLRSNGSPRFGFSVRCLRDAD